MRRDTDTSAFRHQTALLKEYIRFVEQDDAVPHISQV
jgi:hypothetical protein